MGRESFTNPYFVGRLCHAVLQSNRFSTDVECVQAFAKRALQSFTICEGEEGDRTLELKTELSREIA